LPMSSAFQSKSRYSNLISSICGVKSFVVIRYISILSS
jgi:hypothetical protein